MAGGLHEWDEGGLPQATVGTEVATQEVILVRKVALSTNTNANHTHPPSYSA